MVIAEILWIFIAFMLIIQYSDAIKGCESATDRWTAIFIFFIGAPFFLIVSVLEDILSYILPDDWDNDSGG